MSRCAFTHEKERKKTEKKGENCSYEQRVGRLHNIHRLKQKKKQKKTQKKMKEKKGRESKK